MSDTILLYLGAAILFVWGVAHVIPTRNDVAGFGSLSEDNRINITMEWVAEGLALAFVGVLVALVAAADFLADPGGTLDVHQRPVRDLQVQHLDIGLPRGGTGDLCMT
jgi:hypothetical protein